MNIIGPDELVFGVDDLAASRTFLLDYGLAEAADGAFEALDGTCVILRDENDPTLPPAVSAGSRHRKTVWGVADQATLDAIEQELSRDREVVRADDGTVSSTDDLGLAIGFRLTRRRPFDIEQEIVNTPGIAANRGYNRIGSDETAAAKPVTLSHVVFFVPDSDVIERFYVDRLGFVVSDRFENMGPFLRARGNDDHHSLFFIQTPPHMKGLEHFAFHMRGPTCLMLAGSRMEAKGYETFWGPGRHKMGSNWFWYFKSPLGAAIEYDADMDKHDDNWEARTYPQSAENAQLFLLRHIEKWAPGGPPPKVAKPAHP